MTCLRYRNYIGDKRFDNFRHSIHPSNENTNTTSSTTNQNEPPITITTNPLTTTTPAPEASSHSSSMQSIALTNDDQTERRNTTTSQLIGNLISSNKNAHSLLSKLTDARKSLFGKTNIPDPFFSSADENKALLSYILSEPQPQLEFIQEFERNGAQLNAITDEGNTSIHLLARADIQSTECIHIIDYLIKKGCDPSRQNDYGWTAGITFFTLKKNFFFYSNFQLIMHWRVIIRI
jgi:ankyrin repeat protein